MSRLAVIAADWPAIEALLDEALELPPAERESWLQALDAEDATRRGVLRDLLAEQARVETDDFLLRLPCLPDAARLLSDPDQRVGATVGPYRLIEQIGAGGMGRVWLAERVDGSPRRRVALKLPHVVWGSGFGERLARERDILASLEHEHIARLYDAGADADGRPYLAMEYVEGESIDAFCKAHALSIRDRLQLLLQAMQAMTHAHSRLVIHRDLKPGNILVSRAGEVRVLDFGIAKLMAGDRASKTALTELSGRALSRDYASPEQIRGEPLGTASDVYSLAVVAYEILSGARPYRLQRDSPAALEQAIETAEVPLASQAASSAPVARELRGDIDAILNKALKKDEAQRYRTMEAFAEDIKRHLAGQPVEAQPDTLRYRAGKFVARHRLQVSAGVAVAGALLVGIGVATWQAGEARRQAARARTEAATAQAVQAFLQGVFRADAGDDADPDKARNTTARELLDRGAERIRSELAEAPEVRLQLLQTLARMYEAMTLLDKAAELQRERLQLARSHAGARSRPAAEALAAYGHVLALLDRRKEAVDAEAEATAILDAIGDSGSAARFEIDFTQALLDERSDSTRGLAAIGRAVANARARSARADLVRALTQQTALASNAGKNQLARDGMLEGIRIVEADPKAEFGSLSASYVALADAQMGLGELEAAEASYAKAIRLARDRNAIAPIYLHTAERRYGSFLRRHGRLRESVAVLRPGYEWARTSSAGYGIVLPTLVAEYARALIAFGDVDTGLDVVAEAAAMQSRAEDAPEMNASLALFKAQGLIEQGRLAEAKAALPLARAFFAPGTKPAPPLLAGTERELMLAEGRAEDALRDFETARARRGQPPSPAPGEPPRVQSEAARLSLEAGRADAAERLARQALAAIENDPQRAYLPDAEARATFVLGAALSSLGRLAEARDMLVRSVQVHKAVYDPERGLAVADALVALAQVDGRLGDSASATASAAEAQRIDGRHRAIGAQHRRL